MLYPILTENYLYICGLLLLVTWFCRRSNPESRKNMLYLYGFIAAIGFLLAFDWMAGVIFGLLILELGRVLRRFLDKKAADLEKDKEKPN